ncbi:hypothetical protein GCM10028791_14620 [Echinicola sediminis]
MKGSRPDISLPYANRHCECLDIEPVEMLKYEAISSLKEKTATPSFDEPAFDQTASL